MVIPCKYLIDLFSRMTIIHQQNLINKHPTSLARTENFHEVTLKSSSPRQLKMFWSSTPPSLFVNYWKPLLTPLPNLCLNYPIRTQLSPHRGRNPERAMRTRSLFRMFWCIDNFHGVHLTSPSLNEYPIYSIS